MSKEKNYWLAWQLLLPGQASKLWTLVEYFGSPKKAWHARKKDLLSILRLRSHTMKNFNQAHSSIDPVQKLNWLSKNNIEYVCYDDANFPEILRTIFDPPPGLFVRGCLNLTSPAVALVGSRKATIYGKKIAEQLGRDLARAGVTVVSGMARGIDTASHIGAMKSAGYTIAVLGCGVNVVYPPENDKVMRDIISTGAVISEFPPGSAPEPWHFPVRNRIISGLSRCVVVVEAAERSGALITADVALEQGREVAAVPGNISSKLSKGTNKLIKQGARLVEDAADILDEIGLTTLFPRGDEVSSTKMVNLSPGENKIFDLLGSEPVHLDEIIVQSGFSAGEVLSLLMYLELKGVVRQLPGKMFVQG